MFMNATPPASFRDFFEKYYRLILNNLTRRTRNRSSAEDLTQETFMRAAKAFDTTEQPSLSWLLKIAENVFINWVRYQQAGKRQAPTTSFEERLHDPPSPTPNQEKKLVLKQALTRLDHVVNDLPPRIQQCFRLYYVQDYKCADIALMLKIDEASVRSLLSRGRKKVAHAMEKHQDEVGEVR